MDCKFIFVANELVLAEPSLIQVLWVPNQSIEQRKGLFA